MTILKKLEVLAEEINILQETQPGTSRRFRNALLWLIPGVAIVAACLLKTNQHSPNSNWLLLGVFVAPLISCIFLGWVVYELMGGDALIGRWSYLGYSIGIAFMSLLAACLIPLGLILAADDVVAGSLTMIIFTVMGGQLFYLLGLGEEQTRYDADQLR